MNENLYFIAIIPPEEVSEEVTGFKKDFAERFSSEKALKVMPHITLKAPFTWPASKHTALLEWFRRIRISIRPFTIELNNFGAFHNVSNPVVFIHPVMNVFLYILQKEIMRSFKKLYPARIYAVDLKFKPHITIAYRDLAPEKFKEAWEEYKTKPYKAVVEVNSFYLLQYDAEKWNIIDTYSL